MLSTSDALSPAYNRDMRAEPGSFERTLVAEIPLSARLGAILRVGEVCDFSVELVVQHGLQGVGIQDA